MISSINSGINFPNFYSNGMSVEQVKPENFTSSNQVLNTPSESYDTAESYSFDMMNTLLEADESLSLESFSSLNDSSTVADAYQKMNDLEVEIDRLLEQL